MVLGMVAKPGKGSRGPGPSAHGLFCPHFLCSRTEALPRVPTTPRAAKQYQFLKGRGQKGTLGSPGELDIPAIHPSALPRGPLLAWRL